MQSDLFNLSHSRSFENQAFQKAFFEKKYTFRFDQILGASLVLVIFFVLVFAWGAEHGKAVSRREFMIQNQMTPNPAEKVAPPATHLQASKPTIPEVLVDAPEVEVVTSSQVDTIALPDGSESAGVLTQVPSAQSKYTIAHMTYVKKEQALKEMKRLQAKGFQPFIAPSGKYYQICVNGFESRKDANETIKLLRLKGIVSTDAYIRNMPSRA